MTTTVNAPAVRKAGTLQAILLLAASCLPVLGSVLLTPILPELSRVFAGTPGAEALVPLIISIPALMIAIFAPFAGQIVDRVGRRSLLLVAMVVYAIVGTMPLYLSELPAILASRVGVGITEAAIMTCCTTLIVDYFSDEKRRNKYLGLQTVVTTLAATVFFIVGGALGAQGWRTPFWVYAISIIIVIPMFFLIFQPAASQRPADAKRVPVPWGKLRLPLVVTVFGGFAFYVMIVELSYLLFGAGVQDVSIIGLGSAVASLATAIGAFAFARVARLQAKVLLPVAYALLAVGMIVVWFATVPPLVIVGAVVAGLGSGLLLPTLLTWALAGLSFDERGRSTGWWQAAFFFGQFVSPLIIVALTAGLGSLPTAVGVVGIVCAGVAVLLAIVLRSRADVPIVGAEH